jgi:hypothetical protein
VRPVKVSSWLYGNYQEVEVTLVGGRQLTIGRIQDSTRLAQLLAGAAPARPALSLGRLLAVRDDGDRDDPSWQPEYWQIGLEVLFADDPAWSDLGTLPHQDTGFDFAEIGQPRLVALAAARAMVESFPQLRAMWRAQPVRSSLTLERAG